MQAFENTMVRVESSRSRTEPLVQKDLVPIIANIPFCFAIIVTLVDANSAHRPKYNLVSYIHVRN